MATQPAPELLEKFGQVLEKMESEGKITTEMAVAIRASGYTQKEILLASFEDKDKIDENLILEIESKLKEKFSSQAREESPDYLDEMDTVLFGKIVKLIYAEEDGALSFVIKGDLELKVYVGGENDEQND